MLALAKDKKGGRMIRSALVCVGLGSFGLTSPAFAAGEILGGIAQIAGAVSSIVTPGIQAAGEAAVAGIQAGAAVAMTRIAADTTMYISAQNAGVALAQTAAAERINAYNQSSTTNRLGAQLQALREARQSQMELEKIRLDNEKEVNNMRIALAWQQQEANFKLAQMALKTQLVQAGLSTGFITKNSSLTTNRTLLGGNTVAAALPGRLLASIGGNAPAFTSLSVARTAQIQSQSAGKGLVSSLSTNGFVRGSTAGQQVRVASAAPILQSDLANFQQSVPTLGEARGGRARASVLVGAQGHSGYAVSGRPVMGKPSGRPLADR